MVIDNQHGRAHTPIVAKIIPDRTVASTNPAASDVRAGTSKPCGLPGFAPSPALLASVVEGIHPAARRTRCAQ